MLTRSASVSLPIHSERNYDIKQSGHSWSFRNKTTLFRTYSIHHKEKYFERFTRRYIIDIGLKLVMLLCFSHFFMNRHVSESFHIIKKGHIHQTMIEKQSTLVLRHGHIVCKQEPHFEEYNFFGGQVCKESSRLGFQNNL